MLNFCALPKVEDGGLGESCFSGEIPGFEADATLCGGGAMRGLLARLLGWKGEGAWEGLGPERVEGAAAEGVCGGANL
jgi:hypothetical protein